MRSTRRLALAFLLGLLPLCAYASSEPPTTHVSVLYQGLTLDQWRERIKALDLKGPAAIEAVPGLLEIVEDPTVPWFTRRQAALTLGRIGAPAASAIPILERYATGPVPDEMAPPLWAMKALALYGPAAAPATPAISKIALDSSTDPHLQLLSIEALCRIGLAHPLTLSTVMSLLQRDQPLLTPGRLRSGEELDRVVAAIQCLELFRAGGADSVPILLRYSEDREERVRRAVAVTLGAFGPRGSDAAARLAEMVAFDPSLDVRDVAAVSLGQVDGTEWLNKLLHHPQPATRERAALGLGYVPATDRTARASLKEASQDESAVVRIAACESLQRLTGDSRITAPAAARELATAERSVRLRAIRLLTQLGPKAAPARDELQKLKNHPDPQVRRSATRLLESLPQ